MGKSVLTIIRIQQGKLTIYLCSPWENTSFLIGQTPKNDIPPNIAPKIVTPEIYLQIWDSSVTLIGQLSIITLFGAMLGSIPRSGSYPFSLLTNMAQCWPYVCPLSPHDIPT